MSIYDELDKLHNHSLVLTRTTSAKGYAYLLAYRLREGACVELVTKQTLQKAVDCAFDEIIANKDETAFIDKEQDDE